MKITRRDFLKYCGVSAAVLGLSGTDLFRLEQALANDSAPTVLWLQGSSCTGCSMSFLNHFSSQPNYPKSADDVLINYINLAYHPNLMALAGEDARELAEAAYAQGGYVLAVEGGVPTAFGGATCWAWSYKASNGAWVDETFEEVVRRYAVKASAILSIGTCAAYGGIPASGSNPTGVRGVGDLTGQRTINIGGCPPHPDWVVWSIAQLLAGNSISTDGSGRPTRIFQNTVHSQCPRRYRDDDADTFGTSDCLEELGCRGKSTSGNCPTQLWNDGVNWCVNANAPCYACTEPEFPGAAPFYQEVEGGGSDEYDD